VRVAGGRIVDVAPATGARIAKRTRVVDATGKFLIPGLWDMHTHFFGRAPGCPEITFSLAVAHGVTGARDVAAQLDLSLAWRAEVQSDRMIGPRLFGTGQLVDGVPVVYPPISVSARTADDARGIVDSLARRGADFVKAYEMLDREAFFALVEQAKKSGLPVVAHVPLSVLAGDASDAGVRSFEHLRNLELACSSDAEDLLAERIAMLKAGAGRVGAEVRAEIHSAQRTRALDTYDPQRCTALLRKLAANGTWQTATLFLETREARRVYLMKACGRHYAGCRTATGWSGRRGRSVPRPQRLKLRPRSYGALIGSRSLCGVCRKSGSDFWQEPISQRTGQFPALHFTKS
jgi:imidazolonepropionase-like amidohydrolase